MARDHRRIIPSLVIPFGAACCLARPAVLQYLCQAGMLAFPVLELMQDNARLLMNHRSSRLPLPAIGCWNRRHYANVDDTKFMATGMSLQRSALNKYAHIIQVTCE